MDPIEQISEVLEKFDANHDGFISYQEWDAMCDELSNGVVEPLEKQIFFSKFHKAEDGIAFETLLTHISETMKIDDYKGKENGSSLLLLDFISKILDEGQFAEIQDAIKTVSEQAKIIEEIQKYSHTLETENENLRSEIESEKRQQQVLQAELETINARRKIEQEHFEQERYQDKQQIERLRQENQDLLTRESFKEEVRVGDENEKQAKELKTLRADTLKVRRERDELEKVKNDLSHQLVTLKNENESMRLDMRFKTQLLEDTEQRLKQLKSQWKKQKQDMLLENSKLIREKKQLEFDLGQMSRSLENAMASQPVDYTSRATMTNLGLAMGGIEEGKGAYGNSDDESVGLLDFDSADDYASDLPTDSINTPNFAIVPSETHNQRTRSLADDLALSGLGTLGEDDIYEEEDDLNLLQSVGDKQLTKEDWKKHRRTQSANLQKKNMKQIQEALVRASIVQKEVEFKQHGLYAHDEGKIQPGSQGELNYNEIDFPEDAFDGGASLAEVLDAVQQVKEEVENLKPKATEEPEKYVKELHEQISTLEQNTTDVKKEMEHLRSKSLDPETFKNEIKALHQKTAQFHSALQSLQESLSPKDDGAKPASSPPTAEIFREELQNQTVKFENEIRKIQSNIITSNVFQEEFANLKAEIEELKANTSDKKNINQFANLKAELEEIIEPHLHMKEIHSTLESIQSQMSPNQSALAGSAIENIESTQLRNEIQNQTKKFETQMENIQKSILTSNVFYEEFSNLKEELKQLKLEKQKNISKTNFEKESTANIIKALLEEKEQELSKLRKNLQREQKDALRKLEEERSSYDYKLKQDREEFEFKMEQQNLSYKKEKENLESRLNKAQTKIQRQYEDIIQLRTDVSNKEKELLETVHRFEMEKSDHQTQKVDTVRRMSQEITKLREDLVFQEQLREKQKSVHLSQSSWWTQI